MEIEEIKKIIKAEMDKEFRESIRCETTSVQYSEKDAEVSIFYYNMTTMHTHTWSVLRKLLKEIENGK